MTEVLQDIWFRLINFLPDLVGALVVLIVGWVIADLIAWAIDRLLRLIHLPEIFKTARIEELLKQSGSKLDTTAMIASLVKWILILVTFITAADILRLDTVREFLDRILGFLPNVIAAGAILLMGAIFAHFMASVIKGAISAARLSFAELVGNSAKYAILVFAFLAALNQLGIAQPFLQALFYGLVAFLAIAGGLAFGLGGKDVARDYLEKFKKELEG